MLASTDLLLELWHVGTTRCVMTNTAAGPPFLVKLYEVDQLLTQRTFETHDSANEYAVHVLRATASRYPA